MGEQNTIEGFGSLSRLQEVLDTSNAQNVLLVSGNASYEACGARAIVDEIADHINLVKFSDFEVNPKFEDVSRGLALAQDANIDTIVAIGGGSVIDMAKLILAFWGHEGNDEDIVQGRVKPADSGLNFVAVPTTAGSGSESTHFAVVYLDCNKYSVASPFILPKSVILDGKLTLSNSPTQRAMNGLDALAQAIESHWATGSTEASQRHSLAAMPALYNLLPKCVKGVATNDETQKMMIAANHAGRAINISKTTAAHAYSYAFTSVYGIPHGQAVWLTLPAVFEIHYNVTKDDHLNVANFNDFKTTMNEILSQIGVSSENICDQLKQFVSSLGLDVSMQRLGASESDDRLALSKKVNIERMQNNPISFSPAHIATIFSL